MQGREIRRDEGRGAHPMMTCGEQVNGCELSRSNTLHTSGQTRSVLGQSQPNFLHPGKSRGLTHSSIHWQKGREGWAYVPPGSL